MAPPARRTDTPPGHGSVQPLQANPNVIFHFTPVGSSWINQIETWFAIITKQAIRRGPFTSVNALLYCIRTYTEHGNTDSKLFV